MTCQGGASHEISVLGCADKIIAQPSMKSFPQLLKMYPRFNNIPNAGSFDTVDVEHIMALKPDIVVASVTSLQGNKKIESLGIPVVTVSTGRANIDRLLREFKMMSEILGGAQKAEWGHYFITASGGINVSRSLKIERGAVGPEQVLVWNPDVIITRSDKDFQGKVNTIWDNQRLRGRNESMLVDRILQRCGFEVVSVCCKVGRVSKEVIGIKDQYKLGAPGSYEVMCNPVTQAEIMNDEGTEFNIVIGLCVGHDSLLLKHADAMSTVLIAKDKVLGHNPAAALRLSGSYYKELMHKQNKGAK
ncbi:MAG: vitamin B12-transporter protein BtuF [Syntrophorhabdus sp. PtaU1.Bin153]|nr:MAG: vitamin B12-transporter protein BtuF [Syntrophorhabdus sp. PtaU1.Bin153]